MRPEDITVVVLDRDRHDDLIADLREVGAQGVADHRRRRGAVDRGGDPGQWRRPPHGRRWDARRRHLGSSSQVPGRRDAGTVMASFRRRTAALVDAGFDVDRKLATDDLVACGNDLIMAATGVTDGTMLSGVRFDDAGGAVTESLVIRSQSGTTRRLVSEHAAAKVAYLASPSR